MLVMKEEKDEGMKRKRKKERKKISKEERD